MITLDEKLFADLVIGGRSWVIVDEEVKAAIDNSDYGSDNMVCENDPDVVGWSGVRIGQVPAVGISDSGKQLYRLWRREEYKIVGNLARERRAQREAAIAKREAAAQAAIDELRDRMKALGIDEKLTQQMFDTMNVDDIRKLIGLA
tara:strand:- start:303 stop:740 length:438 start_codon:yes stop_codon:yes gene_type:complete